MAKDASSAPRWATTTSTMASNAAMPRSTEVRYFESAASGQAATIKTTTANIPPKKLEA